MLARILWNPIGALVLGVLALGLGVAITTGVDVTCKVKTTEMVAGGTCTNRTGKTVTYEDWQSQQQEASMVAYGLGGVLLVGGTIAVVVRRRRRAAVSR
jgi:LPXTG-motif cell wall-anchored protein